MSDHMEAAVQAAATVLWNQDPTTHGVPAPTTSEEWEADTEGYIDAAGDVIEAALPHIRAMIAADIRAELTRGKRAGLAYAARIAEEGNIMTIAGALAITGGIFLVVAMVLATVAGELYGLTERQLLIISGVTFALAVGFCLAAVWAAVDWIAGLT